MGRVHVSVVEQSNSCVEKLSQVDSKTSINSDYVREGDAAKLLGVTKKFLQTCRWKRIPPAYFKFGSSVRYHVDDLRKYAESCKRCSTSAEVKINE